jgi:hypothetical protein
MTVFQLNDGPVVRIDMDAQVIQSLAIIILHCARGDTMAEIRSQPDGEIEEVIRLLFSKDDQGRRILKSFGPAYISAAVVHSLGTLFSCLPAGSMPKAEGEALGVGNMILSILESATHYCKFKMEEQQEGPKMERKDGDTKH